jgi:F-type H+-transporting ATPase subunit b
MLSVSIGTVLWTTIAFLIVLFLLVKFAWKPILASLKDREESIQNALDAADKAKKEMESLQADNEKLLNEARAERDAMLKEARETKNKIVAEAKDKAKEEADNIISNAREAIHNEKMAAITEMKNQVAKFSIEIAEKILKDELSAKGKQEALIENAISDINLN